MTDLFASAAAFLLAAAFAAVWGAHLFETLVLYPGWAAEAPKSLIEFLATPYAGRLAGFWRALAPSLYAVALIGLIAAVAAGLGRHPALAIAGVCGLIHMAMVLLVFLPTNQKLGFYGGPGAAGLDPPEAKALLVRWGRWNAVRVGVETAGLVAALVAWGTQTMFAVR